MTISWSTGFVHYPCAERTCGEIRLKPVLETRLIPTIEMSRACGGFRSVKFETKDFVDSNSGTAEDKAKWANRFVRFILGGFQWGSFNKDLYRRLRAMFGHCAEYDINGFYFVWFDDTYKCLHWVETVTTSWLCGIGSPAFTWSDVELTLIKWLGENNIHDQIAGYLQAETEQQERAQLAVLKQRYEAPADEPITAHPIPLKIIVPSPVQETGQMRLF